MMTESELQNFVINNLTIARDGLKVELDLCWHPAKRDPHETLMLVRGVMETLTRLSQGLEAQLQPPEIHDIVDTASAKHGSGCQFRCAEIDREGTWSAQILQTSFKNGSKILYRGDGKSRDAAILALWRTMRGGVVAE